MQNKLTDLNNYLFEQIELLNDDDLTGEALEKQIKKSKAISELSGKIIQNASIQLKAIAIMDDLDFAATRGKAAELIGFNQSEEVKKSDEEVFKEAYNKDKNSIHFVNKG